jgi:predicted aspartyl protease
MGNVYVKVGIAGVTPQGDMIPGRASRVEALVDTGATMTLVSAAVAEDAELPVAWNRPETYRTASGRREKFYPADALMQVKGCKMAKMVVGVCASMAEDDVQVILGHDYMQRVRMVVGPKDRIAGCDVYTRRKARKKATSGATGRRG